VTTGNNDAIPVLIDTAGQLGTTSSSRRYKKEIKPMDQTSEAILALKPVTFHYKSDKTGTAQFGLIAEEVAEVNPNLVVRDENGEIYTVRYDAVNAMLLNEFLKEHKKVEQQVREIQEQRTTISELKKSMETVITHLKKQDSKIQKVAIRSK
jgi:septal ring factor EnvC (AmiA/AmiB activator)